MIRILCSMSSCGKDTIQSIMINKYNINPIVSMTSRPMRQGELDGREYVFVSEDEFKLMIKHDKLIEYRTYETVNGTWYYGLPKMKFDKNKDYVVILDVNGAREFINCVGKENCKVFHITCPLFERIRRTIKRGSYNWREIVRRLKADSIDFSKDKFNGIDYLVISNYNRSVDDTVKEILNV